MAARQHHVIIGSGSAGHGAAVTLRQRDPECRITLVTLSRLPFYNRYDLPRVFEGVHDWRELLPEPIDLYEKLNITLRRDTRVVDVDGRNRTLAFAHNEVMGYDNLLVCSGGRGYIPEILSDYRHLMHGFSSFEAAMTVYEALPKGGTAILLGGDMIGLDLALTLLKTGYRVKLVTGDQTFWPHRPDAALKRKLFKALEKAGMTLIQGPQPVAIEATNGGAAKRRVILSDDDELMGDVVMPFYGLVPSVEFMLGAGVDIERGLLVTADLRTTNDHIWAAGDVCQIWSDQEKEYVFYHGWKNVRLMGELAARNMTGAGETFTPDSEDRLDVDKKGRIVSAFWEH